MLLRELIQRAVTIASQGQPDPAATEQTAEALLPRIFGEVGVIAARTERLRVTLRRRKDLSFVDGVAAVPVDVLTAYIDEASLLDFTDKSKRYSHAPWDQFITGDLDTRLGYFAIQRFATVSSESQSSIYLVEPNTSFDPASGPTITLLLYAPCSPVIPAIDAVVAVIDEISYMLITALAESLKLRIPVSARR